MGDNDTEVALKISGDSSGGVKAVDQFVSSLQKVATDGLGPLKAAFNEETIGAAALATALMDLGQRATEIGAQLEKVSLTTSVNVSRLSDLKFAFDATGSSLDTLNNVMFMFETRVENSSSKVAEGLSLIGLSLADLQGLSRDNQLLAISDAFRHAGDGANVAAAAMDIFGRQGRTVLPQLMQPLSDLVQKSQDLGNTWSETDVKAAHAFELASGTMAAETEAAWTRLGRIVAPVTNDIALAYDRMKLAFANVAATAVDLGAHFFELGHSFTEWAGLSHDGALAAEELGAKQDTINKAVKEGAPATISYADAVKYLNDRWKEQNGTSDEALEKQKQFNQIWTDYAAAMAKGGASTAGISLATRGLVKDLSDLKFSHEKIAIATGLSVAQVDSLVTSFTKDAEAAKKATEAHQRFVDSVKSLNAYGKGGLGMIGAFMDPGAGGAGAVLEADNPIATTNGVDEATRAALPGGVLPSSPLLGTPLGGGLNGVGLLPRGTTTDLADALKTTVDWHKELGDTSRALSELATVAGRSLGAVVRDLGEAVTSTNAISVGANDFSAGGLLGKAAGTLSIVSGALSIAGAIGKALNIGGPDAAEVQSRQDRSSAFSGAGLSLDKAGIQAAEDSLSQFGASAAQAQAAVGRVLDAKTPQAFAAAWGPVNSALQQTKTLETSVGNLSGLVSAFEQAGHVLPASMVTTIQSLEKMPGLTKNEQTAIQGLVDAAKPNFDSLEGVAEKYGVTLQGLGPKLAQGQLDKTAQGIFQDFQDLTNAGGEAGNVIGAMHDKIEGLVNQAISSGSSLPAFLQPLIQNLAGDLHDANGNLINITQIKFDDTPTSDGLGDIQKSLDTVNTTLNGDSTQALKNFLALVPNNPFANWTVPVPSDGTVTTGSTGGWVTSAGIQHFALGGRVLPMPFRPIGTDTVPAMLTPGEVVLTRAQQGALFGGGGITIHGPVVDASGSFFRDRASLQELGDIVVTALSDRARSLGPIGLR